MNKEFKVNKYSSYLKCNVIKHTVDGGRLRRGEEDIL